MSAYHEIVKGEMDINCLSENISRTGSESDTDSTTILDK